MPLLDAVSFPSEGLPQIVSHARIQHTPNRDRCVFNRGGSIPNQGSWQEVYSDFVASIVCVSRKACQGFVPRENIGTVRNDTSVLITAIERPSGVDAAVVVEARIEDHQVALLCEVVVIEVESSGLICTWVGLEAECIPSSSCVCESARGSGVCGDRERWLLATIERGLFRNMFAN